MGTSHMEEENLHMLQVKFMTENGLMEELMVGAFLSFKTEIDMRESGSMINKKVMESRFGIRGDANTEEHSKMERNMVKAKLILKINLLMRETFIRIILKEQELTLANKDFEFTLENGRKAK
jgi:hypothetical protein